MAEFQQENGKKMRKEEEMKQFILPTNTTPRSAC
ncbi:hypothetical protein COLO4_35955 [Corchorus olitorius]|uniref:Uncharacterized protein n=1 Tax=Corchorus olitorius TaxID=93759 RepID=A0A1R3GBM5_9ROSI|nr:hypothetical protein COLO4_35955 [Corchorus olitorius]